MNEKIRVIVVDDHPLFREGVVRTLEDNDIDVIGEATSADEALLRTRSLRPDILLLDISIPGGGIPCAISVAKAYPGTKIVILTGSESEEYLVDALKAGARGYVLKGVSAHELIRIIRQVAAGDVYVTPSMAGAVLYKNYGPRPNIDHTKELLEGLNEREHQILDLVAAGHSNREIGQKLFLSENTVKQYMSNIMVKLQVRNRVEATLLILQKNRAS